MSRGTLRIYLGAAPGVGKTFAMLNEGRRRAERGTDVVVGFVETHGRPRTAEQMEGLEVVLVDELAHTNVPGSRNSKRWQDVEELLDAGIHVISTVNIQHLESLNDVVERITGITQRETVPDEVVRRADQIARRDGRRLPRGRRGRRRLGPRRLRPGRERHPARARRQPTVAAPGAAPRLGHQPGAAVVGSDRPPHHLHPGERGEEAPAGHAPPAAGPQWSSAWPR